MNITDRIAKNISRGKGPRISADQIRLCIRRALERGCEWAVETAPHPRGGVATIGITAQSSLDDLERGHVILTGGRGVVYVPEDQGVPPAVALDAALTGRRRPRTFLIEVWNKNAEWHLYFDRDEEVL